MFEQLEGKKFEVADIPQDIAEKRAKQAARVLKKESETSKPKNVNTSALKKKLTQQLEGLCVAEKMVNDLLNSGLGTLPSDPLISKYHRVLQIKQNHLTLNSHH